MLKKNSTVSLLLLLSFFGGDLEAQSETGPPATLVRYTEARQQTMRETLRLTGSIEALHTSVVATEVAGIVASFPGREGNLVKRGAPLAQLRRDDLELRLEAARGQLAEAEARLSSARLRLERMGELAHSEVVSRQNADDAAFDAEAWTGTVQQSQAEVARLERDLTLTTIRAPFSGVVTVEHTQVGQWLDVGAAVVSLISLDELELRLEVPEQYFDRVVVGGPVATRFEALPGYELKGKVRALVPRANPQARTFPAIVRLANSERRLGIGMLATAELPIGEALDATLVPKDAIVRRGEETLVHILNDDGTVRSATVEVTGAFGVWVALSGDVEAGEKVITRGNERLNPAMPVKAELQEYPEP